MCGIAGVVGLTNGREPLQRMLAALSHRGPDDEGIVEVAPNVWLGNRRLAILDLTAAGRMPMLEPHSGCWITYNGEVYNFPELRRELESKGVRFRSRTDTEVVLASWAAWGPQALERMRGMFGLAIYDPRQKEVVLARDPVGEKPIYYTLGRGWCAFASEVRALLASGLVTRRLDDRGLAVYLHNGFCVDPLTLVQSVRAVLPGHYVRVSVEGRIITVQRYWRGPLARWGEPLRDPDALRTRFEESVHLRLVSDVPLGAFLSGGLDSAAVVGAMARAGARVRTFTVTLPGSVLDEGPAARSVASSLGTEHQEVPVSGEVAQLACEALRVLDQPSFDGVNTYIVSKAAKQAGLSVALSGLGGDELFGGYPSLRHALWLARLLTVMGPAQIWSTRLAERQELWGPGKLLAAFKVADPAVIPLASYQATQALFADAGKHRVLSGRPEGVIFGLPLEFVNFLQEEEREGVPMLDRICHYTFRLFLGQRTLRDTDSVSMAVALEVRPPFVDRLLVEEVFTVPARIRCRRIPSKVFEWSVLRALLPKGYGRRGKQGFLLPFREWLRIGGPLSGWVRERLGDRHMLVRAGLEPRAVEELLQRGDGVPWSRLWALVSLLEWVDRVGVEA